MIVWFRVWGERLFPERQLLLRTGSRVRSIALPGWLQAIGLFLCLCWIGGGAYLLHEAANSSRGLRETAAVVPSQPVTGAPSAAVAELKQQLAAANAQYAAVAAQYADVSARLEKARSDAAAAKAENGTLRGALGLAESKTKTLEKAAKALEKNRDELQHRIQTAEQSAGATGNRTTQLAKSLEESRSALDRSEAQRTNLQNQVQELQTELQSANAKASQLTQALDAKERQLQQYATGPGQTRAQLPPAPAARAKPPEGENGAPPAQAHEKPETHSSVQARQRPSELERVIASTGIDINKLLSGINSVPSGEGGPFIALQDARKESAEASVRLQELKKLAKTLPLSSPLVHYTEESGFGPRHDPFNERMGFHPGVDLAAPFKTPVYSTAPGKVVFTGAMRGYGRVVEIDHGHGIETLYAHLHRILVVRGQHVGAHHEIGQLGSTGRSTGPHVHYEIRVDGTPVDPEKFMQAGKNGLVQINDK